MGFLDKVKDTATKAAGQVQKVAETGQEKLEESKLKKRIGELKEELGGIVFAQRTGSAPENAETEITRVVGEIQALEGQIAELRSDAADAAGTEST